MCIHKQTNKQRARKIINESKEDIRDIQQR